MKLKPLLNSDLEFENVIHSQTPQHRVSNLIPIEPLKDNSFDEIMDKSPKEAKTEVDVSL